MYIGFGWSLVGDRYCICVVVVESSYWVSGWFGWMIRLCVSSVCYFVNGVYFYDEFVCVFLVNDIFVGIGLVVLVLGNGDVFGGGVDVCCI